VEEKLKRKKEITTHKYEANVVRQKNRKGVQNHNFSKNSTMEDQKILVIKLKKANRVIL
jgi:hypothetical protein